VEKTLATIFVELSAGLERPNRRLDSNLALILSFRSAVDRHAVNPGIHDALRERLSFHGWLSRLAMKGHPNGI
jgi:hypothetical protein